MNRSAFLIIILLVVSSVVAPIIFAFNAQWDSTNYLYDFSILSCENPVEAGRTGSITVKVGANTAVTVHVEFKGHYSWGEWVYNTKEVHLDPGVSVFTTEVEVPFKTIVEPTCLFYYYVYVTLPGEQWVPECWGLASEVTTALPSDISLDDLNALVDHLAWRVYSSDLPVMAKRVLLSKIEVFAEELRGLYNEGEVDRIY